MAQRERLAVVSLTREEQQRGLRVLSELERLRNELAAKYGKLSPESWEVLNQSRDERTRDLMGAPEG